MAALLNPQDPDAQGSCRSSAEEEVPRRSSSSSGSRNPQHCLASPPALVAWGPQRYLIMDAPNNGNLHMYLKACKHANVTDLIRVCEDQTYSADEVEAAGIRVHVCVFADGDSPRPEVIEKFLRIARATMAQQSCVAVHCVAGLGRAPLLVALGLMEIGKIGPVEAVQYIRAQRRGAINAHQLRFLEQYEPRRAKVGCVIE